MPPERLTRHEISWLLAQEARGAAKTLRTEVQVLRSPGESGPSAPPVETTLDALDDAIEMLSALNAERRGKARRGRIDLAALLCEIAPSARIAIAPGAGTEVFGDEAELRRMLHLLMGQASGNAPARSAAVITIRRQADFVRISTNLGPDTAALGELEQRWLSRMALRHGGYTELEGGTQSILLQADGAADQREVTELRKELEQAQQLGEAYARELASVLASGDIRTEVPPAGPNDPSRFEGMRSLAAATRRVLRGLLDDVQNDLTAFETGADPKPLAQRLARRVSGVRELVHELGGVADAVLDAERSDVDISRLLHDIVRDSEGRAARAGVELSVNAPSAVPTRRPRGLVELLVKTLLMHAIAATPRGGRVRVAAVASELGPVLSVADGGPSIPEASRQDVLKHRIDPTSFGRPAGVALPVADAVAAALDATLEVREDGDGRVEFWIVLPKF